MATLRILYTIYAAGLAAFALAAVAILLFGRTHSLARRARAGGELLVLGVLWPVAMLASRARNRIANLWREHL